MSRWSRTFVVSACMLLAGMIPPAPEARTPDPVAESSNSAIVRSEVRLRKLHLVRPDLIPYPLHYDVYC